MFQLKSGAIDDNAKRPHLASMASTVHEAEKWRGQIVKDISRKVLLIQNRQEPTPTHGLCRLRQPSPSLSGAILNPKPASLTMKSISCSEKSGIGSDESSSSAVPITLVLVIHSYWMKTEMSCQVLEAIDILERLVICRVFENCFRRLPPIAQT
jgi:hypothetical protein